MNKKELLITLFLVIIISVCSAERNLRQKAEMPFKDESEAIVYLKASKNVGYRILNEYKRDQLFFTQGLSFLDKDTLLESSGLYGKSHLQILQADNAKVVQSIPLESKYFGEGSDIIEVNGVRQIHMLTWKARKVFIYDTNLNLIRTLALPKQIKEGWGITHMKNPQGELTILVTDGTNKIFQVDPLTWQVKDSVEVFKTNGQKQNKLNEIEVYKGNVLINIFLEKIIVKVNPFTGELIDTWDFSMLVKHMEQTPGYERYTIKESNYCLNGIAYNEETDNLILTGKKWPFLYQIELFEKE